MSIIHNALKKTQDNLNNTDSEKPSTPFSNPYGTQTPPTPPPPTPPPTETGNNDSNPNKKKMLIIIIVLALFLFGLVSYFILKSKNTTQNNTAPIIRKDSNHITNTNQNSQTPSINKDISMLRFQGSASRGNSIAALINDEIYEAGQSINGMTIKSITKDAVQLELDGEIITLRAK